MATAALAALAIVLATSSGLAASASTAGDSNGTNSTGCSNHVCLEISGNLMHAIFRGTNGCLYDSHFHFWGPGIDFNTPSTLNCPTYWSDWYFTNGRGTYCVEGWWFDAGPTKKWYSLGLPCVTV